MSISKKRRSLFAAVLALGAVALTGCNTVGSAAADLGLAGAGGVAGYHVSDGKIGGAAAGAALGYLGSRVAQSEIQRGMSAAEQRGYDRAMNQAVKQQYWLIQAQQRTRQPSAEQDPRLVPVVVPETQINGVIQNAHVEYLRVAPMKSPHSILPLFLLLHLANLNAVAQIPVTDVANLANNQISQSANIAKWVESINNLRTQIDQLNRQINIQDDIRRWSGNPIEAGAKVVLEGMGERDLVRDYGKSKRAILGLVGSLESLKRTANGNYRVISDLDLNGDEVKRDPLIYRRYAVLDATQENTEQVTEETKTREQELQAEIAVTLEVLKDASTEAETQKLSAKLTALNGQLAQVDAVRRREVDAVALQKIANDARLEQERIAAAELAAKNDYLANQRVSSYLNTLRVRKTPPREK